MPSQLFRARTYPRSDPPPSRPVHGCACLHTGRRKVFTVSCLYWVSIALNFIRVFKYICQLLLNSHNGLAIRIGENCVLWVFEVGSVAQLEWKSLSEALVLSQPLLMNPTTIFLWQIALSSRTVEYKQRTAIKGYLFVSLSTKLWIPWPQFQRL